MNKNKQIIGILGGMGPQASAHLVTLLIDMSIKNGIKNDSDFPEIILDSVPVPNFISDTKNLARALKILKSRVRLLNKMNISQLAIACNTAHIILPDLQSVSDAPFISIINEVVNEVRESGINKVGLLATPSTIHFGLFDKALEKSNIQLILPTKEEQIILEKIIRNIILGKKLQSDILKLRSVAASLKKQGAQGIILGCTELPLIFPKKFPIAIFDCLEILAKALLEGGE